MSGESGPDNPPPDEVQAVLSGIRDATERRDLETYRMYAVLFDLVEAAFPVLREDTEIGTQLEKIVARGHVEEGDVEILQKLIQHLLCKLERLSEMEEE